MIVDFVRPQHPQLLAKMWSPSSTLLTLSLNQLYPSTVIFMVLRTVSAVIDLFREQRI